MSKQRQPIRNRRNSQPIATLPDEVLEQIEADPEFQRIMQESDRAEREGRVYTHEEVRKMLSSRKRRHG
jgi:hypothetical protein